MSDAPQGPGWWQASDDKWYPPPRPAMPGEEQAAGAPPGEMPPPGASGPAIPPAAGPPLGPPGGHPYGGPPNPYGAPPTAPPPASKTPLYVGLGIVAAVALVGGIFVVTDGDDEETAATTTTTPTTTDGGPTTSEPSSPASVTTTGGDGGPRAESGDLEITDVGFTNVTSSLDGTNQVSYGYFVENTGDDPAFNIELQVTFYDAEGTLVDSETGNLYYLAPGASIGVGGQPFSEVAEVTEIDVQPAIPSYAPDNTATGELTTANVNTAEDSLGGLTTTFEVTSTYDVQLDNPYSYAVYRNAAGEIVGGKSGIMDIVQPGGTTSGEVTAYEVIPGTDPAQTEVYVDPGFIF